MAARVLRYLMAVAGLALLALSLWLPSDFGHAAPRPVRSGKLGPDLALLSGDCALFVTVRPGDFTRDKLGKLFAEEGGWGRMIEGGSGVSLASIERLTITNVAGEVIEIIKTHKPFERDKVLGGLERYRRSYKDKGGDREQPGPSEKKVGGKAVHFIGPPSRWTQAVGIVDRHVFVRGSLSGVEALLGSEAARSAEFNDLLALAGQYTLVAGFQGKPLRAVLRREFRRFDPEEFRKDKRAFTDKDKDGRVEPERKVVKKTPAAEKDSVDIFPVEMLPYKPLVLMKTAVLWADIDKGYTVSGRITFDGKEAADDGEHALKTVLYVLRELTAMAPKAERDLAPLAPLAELARKALKGVRIERKGNTLETSARLTVPEATVKKLREDIAAVQKRREEEMKRFRKDRPVDKDRPVFKDKK